MKLIRWPDRGRKRGYGHNILMGIDQCAGTILGIDADESISAWLGRCNYDSWQRKAIDLVFRVLSGEVEHCKNSIER